MYSRTLVGSMDIVVESLTLLAHRKKPLAMDRGSLLYAGGNKRKKKEDTYSHAIFFFYFYNF